MEEEEEVEAGSREPLSVTDTSERMSSTRPPFTTERGRQARNRSADNLGPGRVPDLMKVLLNAVKV